MELEKITVVIAQKAKMVYNVIDLAPENEVK